MVAPVTFFTVIRPFVGEFNELQRLAIGSWLGAVPGSEVLVMGAREGAAEACADLGVTHIPGITTNEHGTELVSDVFVQAQQMARHDWLCEISADIVLGGDFILALQAIRKLRRPFVVGQRWDVTPDGTECKLHPPCGVDYFLFKRDTLGDIPPFAVGRTLYDNWMVWAAMERWGLTVIDATETITALHLAHGYPEYGDKAVMLQSEEKRHNTRLFFDSGAPRPYGINDAPYVMVVGKVKERKA